MSPNGPDHASVREIRVGVHCTEAEAATLVERIALLLCPDPEHAPPCPIPWSTDVAPLTGDEARTRYPELVEQARIERGG